MNISKYKKQGFEGIDINLEISLLEYGLIWKTFKYNLKKRGIKKGETLAISFNNTVYDPGYYETNYGYFTKSELLELDWVEWSNVASYTGQTVEELQAQNTGRLLFDLIGYYGPAEFGL